MKKLKLLILFMFFSILTFAQNKVYENVDVKNKLYVGGDIIYKGETMIASGILQDSITMLNDSIDELRSSINTEIRTTEISSYVDTTTYISVNDTVSNSVTLTTSTVSAYTSNNSRAVLAATGSDSAMVSYLFPTTYPNGTITGVQVSIEYFAVDTGTFVLYFQNSDYRGDTLSLPMKLTSDTTVVFGGSNNLLGLDVLLDSVIASNTMYASAKLSDLLEHANTALTIVATDTTLNVDHLKLRIFYTVGERLEYIQTDYIFAYDLIYLVPKQYPPAEATPGLIYMNTDHHLYVYANGAWKQLDN